MTTTNRFIIILIIFISAYSLAAQMGCNPVCSPWGQNNKMSLKGGTVTITPDIDSIRVGDTLLLSSVIPANLTVQDGNGDTSTINFNGASNMTTDFHLNAAKVSDSLIGGIDSFYFIPIQGSIKTNPLIPDAGKTIHYTAEKNSYRFSCGIIAGKKGIYALSFIDIYQAEKKCLFASIEVVMNNADNHLKYLSAIHYPGSPFGDSIFPVEKTHTYCFKVY